jgi:hypothetical protein
MDYGNYQNDIIRLETITQDKNNYEEQLEKEENKTNPDKGALDVMYKLYDQSKKEILKLLNKIQNNKNEGFRENLEEQGDDTPDSSEQNENIGLQRMIKINKYENSRLENQKYILKIISYFGIIILIYINITSMNETLGLFKYLGVIILISIALIIIGNEHLNNRRRDKHNWNTFDWGDGIPDNKTDNGVRYGSDSVNISSLEKTWGHIKDNIFNGINKHTRGSLSMSTNVDTGSTPGSMTKVGGVDEYNQKVNTLIRNMKTKLATTMQLGCTLIKKDKEFIQMRGTGPMTTELAQKLNGTAFRAIMGNDPKVEVLRNNLEFQNIIKEATALENEIKVAFIGKKPNDEQAKAFQDILSENKCFKSTDSTDPTSAPSDVSTKKKKGEACNFATDCGKVNGQQMNCHKINGDKFGGICRDPADTRNL